MVWLKASKFNVVVTIKDGETFYCTNYEAETHHDAERLVDVVADTPVRYLVALLCGDWVMRNDDTGKRELFRGELSESSTVVIEIDMFAIDIDGTKMLIEHVEV